MFTLFCVMIDSIKKDMAAHKINNLLYILLPNDKANILQFQIYMRLLEFIVNFRYLMPLYLIFKFLYLKKSEQLGFSIPINTFGAGLWIVHKGTIVVSSDAKIGSNCRIHVCVNIGKNPLGNDNAPKIGDNCYIGPGAKIYGDIYISDNTIIGANSVVNKSFYQPGKLLGIPAKRYD
ncbi:LbetaH domain-containing protein [Photobacterium damselae]|uniref:serine acetyltransferase n=1 Tax=Photobacterium damselae TaxID=38293 RepID=UPI001E2B5989|nr:serine acetyltransferase [Photobacterium damselae]